MYIIETLICNIHTKLYALCIAYFHSTTLTNYKEKTFRFHTVCWRIKLDLTTILLTIVNKTETFSEKFKENRVCKAKNNETGERHWPTGNATISLQYFRRKNKLFIIHNFLYSMFQLYSIIRNIPTFVSNQFYFRIWNPSFWFLMCAWWKNWKLDLESPIHRQFRSLIFFYLEYYEFIVSKIRWKKKQNLKLKTKSLFLDKQTLLDVGT